MPTDQLLPEIKRRLQRIYQQYADGSDVAPVELYRTEGLLEAALLLGLCGEREADALIAEVATSILGDAWQAPQGQSLQIAVQMAVAPVEPSTARKG